MELDPGPWTRGPGHVGAAEACSLGLCNSPATPFMLWVPAPATSRSLANGTARFFHPPQTCLASGFGKQDLHVLGGRGWSQGLLSCPPSLPYPGGARERRGGSNAERPLQPAWSFPVWVGGRGGLVRGEDMPTGLRRTVEAPPMKRGYALPQTWPVLRPGPALGQGQPGRQELNGFLFLNT